MSRDPAFPDDDHEDAPRETPQLPLRQPATIPGFLRPARRDSPADGPPLPTRTDEEIYIEEFRVPRSLAPGIVPDLWTPRRPRSAPARLFGIFGRVVFAAGIAALAALLLITRSEVPPGSRDGDQAAPARNSRPGAPLPRLVAAPPSPAIGEKLPLGLAVEGQADGAAVVISGLPGGAALSAGRPLGANAWRLSATELATAVVRPPRNFSGMLDLSIELRLADDSVVDRRALHLAWRGPATAPPAEIAPPPRPAPLVAPAAPPEPAPPAAPAPSAPTSPAVAPPSDGAAAVSKQYELTSRDTRPAAKADNEALAMLVRRSEQFIAVGDIASARVLLQRAAAARDARAALALGATYDPIALERLGVRGIAPDIAAARSWYEKARDLGSPEAQRRLDLLAKQSN